MKQYHQIRLVKKGVHYLSKKPLRSHWKSHLGFVFAAIGSAVGLGNIWRFSYVAGQNGGGAFVIPYLIVILVFGIPLMMLELAAGKKFRTSLVPTLKKLCGSARHYRLIGLGIVGSAFLILTYYVVVLGWTLAYAFLYLTNNVMSFSEFTATPYSLISFFVIVALSAFLIMRGIQGGIEKTCKITIPLLFVLLLVLLLRGLTLPNAWEGIRFYFSPNMEALANLDVWLAALGQAFFSLSIGYGIYLTYASYDTFREDIPVISMVIAGTDTLVGILAGITIFSFVFSFGLDPTSGPDLAFVVFPKIFETIAFGTFFAIIFFLTLFIAGLGATLSMFELLTSMLVDEFKHSRKRAALLVAAATLVVGFPSALSYAGYSITALGMPFLDFMDHFSGMYYLPLTALILYTLLAHCWNPKECLAVINRHSRIALPPAFITWIRIAIPAFLTLFLVGSLIA